MFYRRLIISAACALAISASMATFSANAANTPSPNKASSARILEPLNIAILIQDDLISQVSSELKVTRDFISSLPQGSRVMVGYITSGSLQVRQPFTTDLNLAAQSLRVVRSSSSASPYNPYVEVIEALRKFENMQGRNAVLLISDGLDTSHGFDSTSSGRTMDLDRAIKNALQRDVAVFTFYAPSVGLTSNNRLAASYGQNSLNRLADETGGRAFFQGLSGFVTFDSYFENLKQTLNQQARAS